MASRNPNSPYTTEDIALRDETMWRAYRLHEDLAFTVMNINKVKDETEKETKNKKKGPRKINIHCFPLEGHKVQGLQDSRGFQG